MEFKEKDVVVSLKQGLKGEVVGLKQSKNSVLVIVEIMDGLKKIKKLFPPLDLKIVGKYSSWAIYSQKDLEKAVLLLEMEGMREEVEDLVIACSQKKKEKNSVIYFKKKTRPKYKNEKEMLVEFNICNLDIS